MKVVDRRQICTLLPVFAAMAAEAASAQQAAGASSLSTPLVISLEQMQERKTATGKSWSVAHGVLATGESVNLHQSMQVSGAPEPQLHPIQHTEFILICEGEVEFQHESAGQVIAERAGAGSVLYIPIGTRHAVHNIGPGSARYLVVGIGGDAK
jgi:quercetin dioxygenase-like cupin family protein